MPRRPRLVAGDLAYHVLIRRVGRLPLLEQILAEAQAQTRLRIIAYCLMPNH
jgi:putative transposase